MRMKLQITKKMSLSDLLFGDQLKDESKIEKRVLRALEKAPIVSELKKREKKRKEEKLEEEDLVDPVEEEGEMEEGKKSRKRKKEEVDSNEEEEEEGNEGEEGGFEKKEAKRKKKKKSDLCNLLVFAFYTKKKTQKSDPDSTRKDGEGKEDYIHWKRSSNS